MAYDKDVDAYMLSMECTIYIYVRYTRIVSTPLFFSILLQPRAHSYVRYFYSHIRFATCHV